MKLYDIIMKCKPTAHLVFAEVQKMVVSCNPETLLPCLILRAWTQISTERDRLHNKDCIMIIAGADQTASYFGNL